MSLSVVVVVFGVCFCFSWIVMECLCGFVAGWGAVKSKKGMGVDGRRNRVMMSTAVGSGKPVKVAILGASGYTGAELLRILAVHPQAEVRSFCRSSFLSFFLGLVWVLCLEGKEKSGVFW